MDTGSSADWVSAVANVIVALAAVAAAVQGIRSLQAWRNEATGKRRMELAEDVLADFYEARDVIRWVRFPGSFGSESHGREGREGEDEAVQRHRDTFYVPIKRLTDQSELFSRIRARRYRVSAAFGPDAAAPFEELHKLGSEISVAAQQLMRMGPEDRTEQQAQRREVFEEIVWEGLPEDDKIGPRLENLLKEVEKRFRPEIDGSSYK